VACRQEAGRGGREGCVEPHEATRHRRVGGCARWAVSGRPAAATLGGFVDLVIGFATQQVLGQAIAGTFLLLAGPFKIGDKIVGAGQEGVVEDITAMYTVIRDAEGNKVLIPQAPSWWATY
jgi:hypothetical protein